MTKMTIKEALRQVLGDIDKMLPEERLGELEKYRSGDVAVAMRETQAFLDDLLEKDPTFFERQELRSCGRYDHE